MRIQEKEPFLLEEFYYTIQTPCFSEIVEKKSRFLAALFPVTDEASAIDYIQQEKKRYFDAKHHCFAYWIRCPEIIRYSDDGEPNATAGKPMLNLLQLKNLQNIVAIVTRYFGGTLLGTGGLVRAYQKAVSSALDLACLIAKTTGVKLQIETNYTLIGTLLHFIEEEQATILESQYTTVVCITIVLAANTQKRFQQKWTVLSKGQSHIQVLGNCDMIIPNPNS